MKAPLTKRQNEVYEFIRSFLRTERKPPTHQEIGRALGLRSTNAVSKLLKALEAKGYIQRTPHAARSLRLIEADADPFGTDDGVPNLMVVSRTASDAPEQLRARPNAYFMVDPYFLRGHEQEACLIGRAGDDGMNSDGILKGDYLLIEEQPWQEMRNGEMAAVLVENLLMARRFEYANDRFHLRPADRYYTEETFAPDNPKCYIIGRIIGLMRRF